jgi:hypothetical protein
MKTTEAEPARPTVRANDSALRDWVRALEGTAPVTASPQRLLYHVIVELAEAQGDAPALIAAGGGESLTLSGAHRTRQPFRALGARSGAGQGRSDLPDDAEPARISGDMARPHQRGRCHCADQYRAARTFGSPIASTSSRRNM